LRVMIANRSSRVRMRVSYAIDGLSSCVGS
jgi:hypothetical protein